MILFGIVLGRWWKIAIPLGAVLWPALLLTYGILQLGIGPLWMNVLLGVVVGAVNTAVGVGIHHGAVWLYRLIQSR
jgi:uncharacterized protein (DUF2062 family)